MIKNPILKTKSKNFQEKVKNAPTSPGCYIYYGKNKKPIYVGKAKILKNRVKSYFANFYKLDKRIQLMVENAHNVEFFEVDSEFESLILENNLIKKYRPKYNVMLRDDKSYIYVRFEKKRKPSQGLPTKFTYYQDYPSVSIVRQPFNDKADYFGPYPESVPVKRVLAKLRRVFPYCSASRGVYQESARPLEVASKNKKPCFYFHIGLCKGACAGLESKEEYNKRFSNIKKFFEGKKGVLIEEMETKMKNLVKDLDFEEAAQLRDQINDLKYVGTNISIGREVDDIIVDDLKTKQRNNAVDDLIAELEFSNEKLKNHEGFKIECYDISNIQGTNAVGAMTVMVDGKLRKDLYRKFKIRMKNEPNDFAMLQEVLTRRFKHIIFQNQKEWLEAEGELPKDLIQRAKNWKVDESFSVKPDLIIIDGGKGQLASTYKILYNFGLHNDIPMVGLAKKEEEIFKLKDQFNDDYVAINNSSEFVRILLPRRSESLFLVQRIRDEAHRFGITFHRNLRSKKMLSQ